MRSFEIKQTARAAGGDGKSFLLLAAVSVAVLAGTVIGAFGALAALLSLVIVLVMAVAVSDYRAGIVVSIFLLPLSATHLIPREMFGIVGMNPLNLTLAMSITMLAYMHFFRRGEIAIPACPRQLWIYLSLLGCATMIGALHVSSIPPFYKLLRLINFDTASGYVRDILLKPMLILVTAFMLSIAVRNARKPGMYMVVLFCSALVLPIVVLVYIAQSGMPLSKLAANNSRGFLSILGIHANELGLMFNMAFTLALFYFFSVSGALKKWAMGTVVAILLLATILTFSRGAYLGVLTASAYFLYTRRKFRTIVIGLLFLFLAMFLMPEAIMERATTGAQNEDVQTMSAGRVDHIWIPLLPEVLTSPIIGHGLSSILWSEAAREGTILKVGHPHSAYLGVLLDTGLLGAAVIFAFFRHMWRFFTKLAKESCESAWQGFFTGAAACIPVLMVQGLTDDRFTPTFPQTFLWLAYGMAIAVADARRGAGADSSVPAEPTNVSIHS